MRAPNAEKEQSTNYNQLSERAGASNPAVEFTNALPLRIVSSRLFSPWL
jgi:hypothetical protein